jgi:hypothetical protein
MTDTVTASSQPTIPGPSVLVARYVVLVALFFIPLWFIGLSTRVWATDSLLIIGMFSVSIGAVCSLICLAAEAIVRGYGQDKLVSRTLIALGIPTLVLAFGLFNYVATSSLEGAAQLSAAEALGFAAIAAVINAARRGLRRH